MQSLKFDHFIYTAPFNNFKTSHVGEQGVGNNDPTVLPSPPSGMRYL